MMPFLTSVSHVFFLIFDEALRCMMPFFCGSPDEYFWRFVRHSDDWNEPGDTRGPVEERQTTFFFTHVLGTMFLTLFACALPVEERQTTSTGACHEEMIFATCCGAVL